jgi:hypothetical protein
MTRRISAKFKNDVEHIPYAASYELAALKSHWSSLEKQIKKKRRALAQLIPKDDPIRFTVDLLTPLGRIADETLHTRALAYLLDGDAGHGLGRSVLNSLLMQIANVRRGTGASQVSALARRQRTRICVIPEYRYSIEGIRNRSVARCDIWITIESRKAKALAVIENKIGAPESRGQLGWYQRKALTWCKSHHARAPILIFLSPDRIKKEGWVSLSYVDLACALRRVRRRNRGAAGWAWLGFYIAAITNGVLKADVRRPQDIDTDALNAYLGRKR